MKTNFMKALSKTSEYLLHIPEATLYFAKNPVLAPLGNFFIARSLGYDILGGVVQYVSPAANHALKDWGVWAFSGIYRSTGSAFAANFASFSLYFSAQVLSLAVTRYPVDGVCAAVSVALDRLRTLAMDAADGGRDQLLTSMGVLCVSGALSAAATWIAFTYSSIPAMFIAPHVAIPIFAVLGAVVIGSVIDNIAAQCFPNKDPKKDPKKDPDKGPLYHNKVNFTNCFSAVCKGVELFWGGISSSFWHDVDYLCKLIGTPGFLVADSKHWGNLCTLMSLSKVASNADQKMDNEQSKLLRTTISNVFGIFAEVSTELKIQIVNTVVQGLGVGLNKCKINDDNTALVPQ